MRFEDLREEVELTEPTARKRSQANSTRSPRWYRGFVTHWLFLLSSFVCTGAGSHVNAQSLGNRFQQLDRDGDGIVTRQEAGSAAWFDSFLRRVDANGDGRIQKSEIGATTAPAGPNASAVSFETLRDVRYRQLDGVETEHLSLDLYIPRSRDKGKRPTIVWVHGGSWKAGSKESMSRMPMLSYYMARGWNVVSINYRLLPDGRHPNNAEDVAAAVAWVHENVRRYGGDPNAIYLSGHSAGGHLAALVATNPRFLNAHGLKPSDLRGVILFDPAVLDVVLMLPGMTRNASNPYVVNFGQDSSRWPDASPTAHLNRSLNLPPILLLLAYGMDGKTQQARDFAAKGRRSGHYVDLIDATDFRSHASIVSEFGKAGEPTTKAAQSFFQYCDSSERSRRTRQSDSTIVLEPTNDVVLEGRTQIADYQFNLLMRHGDRNRDGDLSRSELPTTFREHLDALDKNSNGRLEKDELTGGYLRGPLLPSIESGGQD